MTSCHNLYIIDKGRGKVMLQLKNIKKTYKIGEIETHALKGVSVAFREKEFVAILGTSGSGKTTCLNIIGGLDNYTDGDLILNGKSTKDFTENQRKLWTNKLCNLVLISNKKNVKLGNLDFKKKKEEYLKHRMDVFNNSKILLDKSSKWDEATLKSRQNTLVNMLVNNN